MSSAPFQDFRHAQRFRSILRTLSACPDETVPQANMNRVEAQSIYRFWSNPQVKASQLIASQRDSVLQQLNTHAVVLSVQDTTDLNFGTQRPKTTGYCQIWCMKKN
ncbi:MAG: transposase DNA-binding-containing protein [Elainella sp.]